MEVTNTEIFTIKEYVLYKKMYILKDIKLKEDKSEYYYVNNTHDKIFRKALDNKNDAVQIINRVLSQEERILPEEIQKYKSSYISNNLKNSEADIVYKLKNKDVFFLIEHQTKIDYSMPYRILKYEVEIIESALEKKRYKNKDYEYPVIIPIVLYTGDRKWNAKLDLREVQLKWKKYQGIELSRYSVLDINQIDNNELLKEKDIISKLMIIEKSKNKKEFKENIIKICKELNKNKGYYEKEEKEFLSKAIKTIIYKNMQKEKIKEIIGKIDIWEEEDNMRVVEMLRKELEKDRAEARKLGLNEGLKEGRKEGKKEGIREGREIVQKMITNMVKNNFPISIISSISGLKETEIKKMIEKDTIK